MRGRGQVSYRVGKNAIGTDVFLYDMVRRPGQEALLSKTVVFGGSSAPRGLSIQSRARQVGALCHALSLHRPALNTTPCLAAQLFTCPFWWKAKSSVIKSGLVNRPCIREISC